MSNIELVAIHGVIELTLSAVSTITMTAGTHEHVDHLHLLTLSQIRQPDTLGRAGHPPPLSLDPDILGYNGFHRCRNMDHARDASSLVVESEGAAS